MVNNLLSVWSTIGSVVLAILILLVMITVHEFGHWVAGKILNFKINEFSIGFGPALFKHKYKKSGEVFALRLIPLGGYCAFEGEDSIEEEKPDLAEPVFEEEKPIAAETPAQAVPEQIAAPLPEAKDKRKKKPRGAPGKFTEMKPWKRIIVLLAGAFMNYVLALFLIIVCFFAYGQTMTAVYTMDAGEGLASEYLEYSLKDKDIFLKANGKNLYLTTDLAKAVNGKKKGDLVEFTVSRVVDAETNAREERTVSVMLRADVNVKNSADLDNVWEALGVEYSEEEEAYMLAGATYRFGFFETLGRSFMYSFKIAGSIFKVLGELLTGKLGISALGGPVSTIAMTSQVASRSFRNFLEIAGFIGVNLAVFNLLPIPALDGSKIVFTVIEWIRGKPISRKVEAIIHGVGFILLLGFAVLVDILQFVL